MLRSRWVVLATAVLVLGACGGGGVESTEVRTYAPWSPGGELNSDVAVTGEVSGSCFSFSLILARRDSFRCALDASAKDGSTLADPCFAGPTARVVCLSEPGGQATLVMLTTELPAPDGLEDESGEQVPWAMVLGSGEKCSFLSGATAAVGNERLNYACGDDLSVYGPPERSQAVWTVRVGRDGSSELTASTVELAWF